LVHRCNQKIAARIRDKAKAHEVKLTERISELSVKLSLERTVYDWLLHDQIVKLKRKRCAARDRAACAQRWLNNNKMAEAA
jgi:hypothetical protein